MQWKWIELRWIVAAVIYIYFGKMEWIWMQGILALIIFIYSLIDLTTERPEERTKLIKKAEKIKELEARIRRLEAIVKKPDNDLIQ